MKAEHTVHTETNYSTTNLLTNAFHSATQLIPTLIKLSYYWWNSPKNECSQFNQDKRPVKIWLTSLSYTRKLPRQK